MYNTAVFAGVFCQMPRIRRRGRKIKFDRLRSGVKGYGILAAHLLLIFLSLATTKAGIAADLLESSGYAPVVLQAKLRDRTGNPLAGIPLLFTGTLDGIALLPGGTSTPYRLPFEKTAVTDSHGLATASVAAATERGGGRRPWFRGRASASVQVASGSREISLLGVDPEPQYFKLPASPGLGNPQGDNTLRFALDAFEEADTHIAGFPVWTASSGKADRIVVLLEGFDIYNDYSATDVMYLVSEAGDVLRRSGITFMVVNYPNSYQSPDKLAAVATTAVQAASAATGHKVTLAGLSMGGLVARWALVEAENRGEPLPVHTLLELDSPNRGANINPGLQALISRYGSDTDRRGIQSEAAGALLLSRPANIRWRRLGVPLADRMVPVHWTDDTSAHDRFYTRLRALNANNGYPTACRRVAVANSSRRTALPERRDLLHLWLPFSFSWMLRARPVDHAVGSVLPEQYSKRFVSEYPFGIAGSRLSFSPTFIPASSALDAEADETPPFDAFYARPDNLPNRAHDDIDPCVAKFVVREILSEAW